MHKLVWLILIIIALTSCEEFFLPDINDEQSHYVFEGFITDQMTTHRIKITQSQPFDQKKPYIKVLGAIVTIEDKSGTVFQLTQDSLGYYLTDSTVKGSYYHEYRLRAIMPDGKEYLSNYDMLQPSPAIDSLMGEVYETRVMRDGGNGIYFEELIDGLRILNNTPTLGYTPYYRYTCDLLYQSEQYYTTDTSMPFSMYIFRPANAFGNIYVGNGNDYAQKNIQKNPLFFADRATLNLEFPDIYTGLQYHLTRTALTVQVNQFSLSQNAYNFWKAIVDQQKASNYLFDPVESQIEGNIKCTSDTTELVFGYFGASAISRKCSAFSLGATDRIRSKNLSEFTYLDSVTIIDSIPPYFVTFN